MKNRYGIVITIAIMLVTGISCKSIEVASRCRGVTGPNEGCRMIKAAVVTGGHDFEQKEFLELFEGYKDIEYVHERQQDESEIFEDVSEWPYDVIVLFHMTQEISPRRKANFVKLLEKGVGVVAVHHSIAAFQKWPEYRKIIGGRYCLEAVREAGVTHRAGDYRHDVDFMIHIEDEEHPITRGLSDFSVHDETYKYCVLEPDNHVLLSTDEPSSDKAIGWVSGYGKGQVCYIEPGHGASIYADENYRGLIAQAIRWSAGRL